MGDIQMTLYEEVITLADRLSVAEKVSLLAYVSGALKHDLEVEAFKRMPWNEFIDKTAGILTDDPIQRPEQLPLEDREPITIRG
jgi:hypothetical protein